LQPPLGGILANHFAQLSIFFVIGGILLALSEPVTRPVFKSIVDVPSDVPLHSAIYLRFYAVHDDPVIFCEAILEWHKARPFSRHF
jgi:hypothetical protein